jgi:hypothetical protein
VKDEKWEQIGCGQKTPVADRQTLRYSSKELALQRFYRRFQGSQEKIGVNMASEAYHH